MKNKIYCFGDSHIELFAKKVTRKVSKKICKNLYQYFKTWYVGSATAYNLCKKDSRTKAKMKIFKRLKNEKKVPPKSMVMLDFGEIDCRVHLAKRIINQKNDPDKIIEECINRYFSVVQEIIDLEFKVIIFGPIASTILTDTSFPQYGTCIERNNITKLFNSYAQKKCEEKKCTFVSIFENLIDEKGITKWKFYRDSAHVGYKVWPILIKKMNSSIKDFRIYK